MLQTGRNILSLIVSRVLAGLVLFLIYTRLAQYLGTEATGQYGLLAGYITVFSFFVDLGISQYVIKKISEDRTHTAKYLSNYFIVQFILGVVFMLIMDTWVFFADYPDFVKHALYVTGFGLFLSSLILPFRGVVTANQKLGVVAKINFVNSTINGLMMLTALLFTKGVFFLAFISVTVSFFDLIFYSILVSRRYVKFKFEWDTQFIKQMFIASLPFTFLTVFSIYNRLDILLIPHYRNFVETGYYSAVYKFWDTLAFLPGVIGISLYPFFAEAIAKKQMDQVKQGLETYTRYMIALGLPMTVGSFLLSKKIILSFFGLEFLPAADALWILIAAVSVLFIYGPLNSLMVSQKTKAAAKITGANLVFNLTANIILLPIFGFVVSAVITLVSEIIQTIGYNYVVRRDIIKFKFLSFFVKPLIASVIMAGVIGLLHNYNVWLVITAAGIAYGTALIGLKFFQKEDLDLLKASISRKPVGGVV